MMTNISEQECHNNRKNKHIILFEKIESLENILDYINKIIHRIKDSEEVSHENTPETPLPSLWHVLNESPDRIENFIEKCNKSLEELESLLF